MKDLKQADLNQAKERLIGLREINKEKSDSTMFDLLQEEIGGDAENYYKYEECRFFNKNSRGIGSSITD